MALLGTASLAGAADPNQGPGGPILIVTNGTSNFGRFYAEILRTEGLNSFAVIDIGALNSSALSSYDVVILGKTALTSSQVTTLTNWVNAGGNLVAMDPDSQLYSLGGVAAASGTLANAYLRVDTSNGIGNGISGETIQYHGTARRLTLGSAASLATLYSTATAATTNPAITLRSVGGNGGQVATFAFDLATSIVYTRQGNPAWAGQERDGTTPIRSDDMFFGNAASDPQPNWIDLSKASIPQADEQQRLLVNLIVKMNLDRKPLPRFWYFPRGEKAVVVMTGDDHGYAGPVDGIGTAQWVNDLQAASPAGCSLANWECVRGTSYLFTNGPLTNAQAAAFTTAGFEIGLHIDHNCSNYTQASLEATYVQQIAEWQTKYSSAPAPLTERHHCVVWSDWASGAKVQLNHGIRLDTTYYYWPSAWAANNPGHFNGSAMPMRFADTDGTLIDNYQTVSQMTDESGQAYPYTSDTLLDRALFDEQYGVYTVNAHPDNSSSLVWDSVVQSALDRGVPVVSARQMLAWLDGRNGSSFGAISWSGNSLTFTIAQAAGANGLTALVPKAGASTLSISTIKRNGSDVAFEILSVKGIEYASFPGAAGTYVATYAADSVPPTVVARSPASSATGVQTSATVNVTFSEALDAATVNGSTFELRTPTNSLVTSTVSYNSATFTVTLTPSVALAVGTTYTVIAKGGMADPRVKDVAGNALITTATSSFTTVSTAACPCSIWPSNPIPAINGDDPAAVELGVKFKSDANGYITGVRFYKAAGNTGTHTGSLWSSAGQRLATATFVNETATGWQQVNFAAPVAVTAGTTYVASYFAPNGHYSGNLGYFSAAGADSGVLHAFRDGAAAGSNGTFTYGSSAFPSSAAGGLNYWVDVVFNSTSGSGDASAPSVTITSPTSQSTLSVSAATLTLAGTASDNVAVTQVTWANDRGGSGTATGTANWTVSSISLSSGVNVLTVTARDAAGNPAADTLTVTYTGDTIAPTVTSRVPASGASGVAVTASPTVVFSEAMDASSINPNTVELRNAANAAITGVVSYNASTLTATFTPSASLTASAAYTLVVKGGTSDPRVKDLAGNALAANSSASFTTAASASCPCTIWSASSTPAINGDDPGAIELGVRFTSDTAGYISGIRFYKAAGNTGTHTGSLWNSAGQRLATATFVNESVSGWQQVNFSAPVAIAANTSYVASYFAPNGHYSGNVNYFSTTGANNVPLHAPQDGAGGSNGVYRYSSTSAFPNTSYQGTNYWVDVVFSTSTTPDTTAPLIAGRSPASGEAGVAVGSAITVTFNEAMNPASFTNAIELRDPTNALVATTVSYNPANLTATVTPAAALSNSWTYTMSVKGGASDPRVKDAAGNAMTATSSWTFTTATAVACPCSLFAPSTVPAINGGDPSGVEVGVRFRSEVSGFITGIRFYKAATNTGTHIGSLWTTSGQRLATANFVNESGSGWQQVNFAAPVAIAANTTYVASYYAPNGNYSGNLSYFIAAGVDRGVLHAPQDVAGAGNGLYKYGGSSVFPDSSYQGANYWVDVVFTQ